MFILINIWPGITSESELQVKRILDYLFWCCVACCCALSIVSVVATLSKLKFAAAGTELAWLWFCINLMNLNLVLVKILCHITKIVMNISLEFGWFFKPCPKYWPTYSCLTNLLFFKLFVTVFIKVCLNIWIADKLLQIVLQPMLHILLLSV